MMLALDSREALLAARGRGEAYEVLFFWGHRPQPDGRIGPSCLSQWYAADFAIGGVRYRTAEHFMMAEKARLFGDHGTEARILEALTAQDAKGLGRKVQGFAQERWTARRVELVIRGNIAKFTQNPRLHRYLLSTSPKVLVEASPEDAVWGIGLHRDDPRASDPGEWQGTNLLGFALMTVRDRIGGQQAG
ncbi:MAG: NADAR family protein [Candidatus Schekmanbacteria bacterium]|nr:NADAR family protein [Candidatus Schekmanbacteria bacterium]